MPDLPNLQRIYTVVLDYENCACATQFQAASVMHALQLWVDDLSLTGMYGLNDLQREGLAKGAKGTAWKIMPLEELHNIWWVTIRHENGSVALLHIVETVVLTPPRPPE
jgi:hypothetical protein